VAFNVETTATYVGPVTTCFVIAAVNDATSFKELQVLHSENNSLVDRTVSRNFQSRSICAKTDSLSPFVVVSRPTAPSTPPSTPTLTMTGGTFTYDGQFHAAMVTATDANRAPVNGSLTVETSRFDVVHAFASPALMHPRGALFDLGDGSFVGMSDS